MSISEISPYSNNMSFQNSPCNSNLCFHQLVSWFFWISEFCRVHLQIKLTFLRVKLQSNDGFHVWIMFRLKFFNCNLESLKLCPLFLRLCELVEDEKDIAKQVFWRTIWRPNNAPSSSIHKSGQVMIKSCSLIHHKDTGWIIGNIVKW